MKPHSPLLARVIAVLLVAGSAFASHGHDAAAAAPAAAIAEGASPRFTAVSETFELVGVLSGRQLTLYLDRYADNSPVRNAQIDVEIGGGTAVRATPQGADAYQATFADAPKPGVLPVTVTVIAGDETDLLAGELDVHRAAQAGPATPALAWPTTAGWLAGATAVLALLVWGGRRAVVARQAARHSRTGSAA